MKRRSSKRGFTLPEVLVSVAVLSFVVIAATNLLVASIRSNAININTIVAYGLAQEGIEAVRNIRDSDWLLGADFRGQTGKQGFSPWGSALPGSLMQSAFYTVDFKDPLDIEVKTSAQLLNVAPWKLEELAVGKDYGKSPETLLFKKAYGSSKELRYTHESQSAEKTPFHRYVSVTPVEYSVGEGRISTKIRKYRVASVVEWEEYGTARSVRLETELTDWKKN
jgi:prepilin-type N-terminal cleavage/methylation domain-containing protein